MPSIGAPASKIYQVRVDGFPVPVNDESQFDFPRYESLIDLGDRVADGFDIFPFLRIAADTKKTSNGTSAKRVVFSVPA